MKSTIFILIVSVFCLNSLTAQVKGIKIFNEDTQKEVIIKENKRIRIKTIDGVKISGRYKAVDNDTIEIKGRKINLNQIVKLKRNPLLVSILTNGIMFYFGAGLAGASIAIYAFSRSASSFLLVIPSVALIYGGIKSPNILKGYKTQHNWSYKIITITK